MRGTHLLLILAIPALMAAGKPGDAGELPPAAATGDFGNLRAPAEDEAGSAEAPHSVRLSLATLDLGENSLNIEVRFFWDDLQIAVMEATDNMQFELAETPEVDRIIQDYLNDMLVLQIGDQRLTGTITGRGIEPAARQDEVMWWYSVEYPVSGPPERLYVKNRLLFNMFEDQRNIMHVVTKSGRERAYYFSWDEEDVTVPLK